MMSPVKSKTDNTMILILDSLRLNKKQVAYITAILSL